MKKNIDRPDFIEIKIFCSVKDNIMRIKIQVIDWEKIFSKRVDKRLVSKKTLKTQQETQFNLKWEKDLK